MVTVPLTRGMAGLIDDEDAGRVLRHRWHAHRCGDKWYVRSKIAGAHVYLHRWLLGVAETERQVDHVNGDGLDNRRSNLRACSRSENARNRTRAKQNGTSGFIGVTFDRGRQRWIAFVRKDRRNVFVGRFATAEEAARARHRVAQDLFGAFAGLNFPSDLPGFG